MLRISPRHAAQIVGELRRSYGADLSPRVVGMVRAAMEGTHFPPRRRVDQLWMPDLSTKAWYEPAEIPWIATLEAAAKEIADECRAVTASPADLEYYLGEPPAPAPRDDDGLLPPDEGWKAFFLRRSGIWRRDHCRRCPVTASILSRLPLSAGDVMFSVLAPGSKIVPHHGLNNLDLTCHLAIDVPPDCGLEVDGEARSWTPSRALVFDDSYRHWAWNRSDEPRRVLLFDFWNPELSVLERTQIKTALPLLFGDMRAPSPVSCIP